MEPLIPGSVVISLKGRDKGAVFAVIGYVQVLGRPSHLLVADGRLHSVESPKKKNPIHLQTMCEADDAILAALEEGTLSDKRLREALRSYQFHA